MERTEIIAGSDIEQRRGGRVWRGWTEAVWLLCVLAVAAVRYWVSPGAASELWTRPDEVEPAVVAQRWVTEGRFDIELGGVRYPMRYPPGFAVLLSPAYVAMPGELGAGIVVVLGFGLVGVGAAYGLGRVVVGGAVVGGGVGGDAVWGRVAGAMAAGAVMAHPGLAHRATILLTDTPATALGLVGAVLFVWAVRRGPGGVGVGVFALAGVVAGLAAAVRPSSGLLVLPWVGLAVWAGGGAGRRAARLGGLAVGPAAAFVANGVYQWRTFGDFWRTGYQYWCPVPYDYPGLAFSWRFVGANVAVWGAWEGVVALLAGAAGGWVLWRGWKGDAGGDTAERSRRALVLYCLTTAVPISVFYLFYRYHYLRFHDLAAAAGCVLGAIGVADVFRRSGGRSVAAGAVLAVGAAVGWGVVAGPRGWPGAKRVLVASVLARTEADAVIVVDYDPLHMEATVVRGSARAVLPWDRETEYASKVVAAVRIADPVPAPRDAADHRCPGLIRGGAQEVYAATVLEDPEAVAEVVRSGRPVYLALLRPIDGRDERVRRLLARCRAVPVAGAPELVRLELRR